MVELRVHSDFLQNFYLNGKGKLANNDFMSKTFRFCVMSHNTKFLTFRASPILEK